MKHIYFAFLGSYPHLLYANTAETYTAM